MYICRTDISSLPDPLVSQCGVLFLTSSIEDFKHAGLLIDDHLLSVRVFDGRIVCLFASTRVEDNGTRQDCVCHVGCIENLETILACACAYLCYSGHMRNKKRSRVDDNKRRCVSEKCVNHRTTTTTMVFKILDHATDRMASGDMCSSLSRASGLRTNIT